MSPILQYAHCMVFTTQKYTPTDKYIAHLCSIKTIYFTYVNISVEITISRNTTIYTKQLPGPIPQATQEPHPTGNDRWQAPEVKPQGEQMKCSPAGPLPEARRGNARTEVQTRIQYLGTMRQAAYFSGQASSTVISQRLPQ